MKYKSYAEKLRDPRWQKKRLKIMERDKFACLDCGSTTRTLEVHHCFYEKDPWEVDDWLLRTVCEQCHDPRQETEDSLKRIVAGIFAKSSMAQLEDFTTALVNVSDGVSEDYLPRIRWIDYAKQYPNHQVFVEMVLGDKIDWSATP